MLHEYEKLLPGTAERLLAMAEEEGRSARNFRTRALDSEIEDLKAARKEARVGQVFGLIIGLTAISCGTYAGVNGSPWTGGFIGTGGVVALVAASVDTSKPAIRGRLESGQGATPGPSFSGSSGSGASSFASSSYGGRI